MCVFRSVALSPNSNGIDKNLYVGGKRPTTTSPVSGMTISDGGETYQVYTNPQLQSVGLGYIIRWRVANAETGEAGAWIKPPANWNEYVPPASAGIPFWKGRIESIYSTPVPTLNSLQDWYGFLDTISPPYDAFRIYYSLEVAVRYALIQDPMTIPGLHPLNPTFRAVTLTPTLAQVRPNTIALWSTNPDIKQTLTVILPPTGSCTTPSVDPSTVHFSPLFNSDIPNPGNTAVEKLLNLTFTNCPRINIGWYVHANGKWVNSSQGIVGMSGSTPNANPVIGNPRGIGVQLLHNNSIEGNGPVYISSHDTDPNKQVYWRAPSQGINSNTGVTHTIPLRARVIRTHPNSNPIIPGGFNTSVIVAIQYQ